MKVIVFILASALLTTLTSSSYKCEVTFYNSGGQVIGTFGPSGSSPVPITGGSSVSARLRVESGWACQFEVFSSAGVQLRKFIISTPTLVSYNNRLTFPLASQFRVIASPKYPCPSGTVADDTGKNDIGGCGITSCNWRYVNGQTLGACRDACAANSQCKAFTYAPRGGDTNHRSQIVCTLYSLSAARSVWGPRQVFCTLTSEPATLAPSTAPSMAPTQKLCRATDVATFDWDKLTTTGADAPKVKFFDMEVDEKQLTLNIKVGLTYEGKSSCSGCGQILGTSYVLDFEDYDAHEADIRRPGTCQNRKGEDFVGKDFNSLWTYSTDPALAQGVGTTATMAYPPAGKWDIYMDPNDQCQTVVYAGNFSWNDLVGCKASAQSTTSYVQTTTNAALNRIELTGTFYVNVVSPMSHRADVKFYRVYQLLSQPFIIAIKKKIQVLGVAGIDVMTISVIAVYKEDAEEMFKLVVLTEAQEYLELTRSASSAFRFVADGGVTIDVGEFSPSSKAENAGCLHSKNYICSQLWEITANGDCTNGDTKYTDFSGAYTLEFVPKCRDEKDIGAPLARYCDDWLNVQHKDLAQGVEMTANLVWKDEDCDPELFEVQFQAEMNFFVGGYSTAAPASHLYRIEEDTIYIEVSTNFPTDTYNVFDTKLINVWVCSFDPLTPPQMPIEPDTVTGGCFSPQRDGAKITVDGEEPVYHIYSSDGNVEEQDFDLVGHADNTLANKNKLRFSFKVPSTCKIARDKLYVQAQVEVLLSNGQRRRRLLLDSSSSSSSSSAQATQMNHFLGDIQVTAAKVEYSSPLSSLLSKLGGSLEESGENPQDPSSVPPMVKLIGALFGLILAINFGCMCYYLHCRSASSQPQISFDGQPAAHMAKRNKSDKLNEYALSDADDSEANAINIVSE